MVIRIRILFMLLVSVMVIQRIEAQNTLWDLIYCLNGGENKTVRISRLNTPNPVGKPGWNLIFNDEFTSDSLNDLFWNRSNPWDDGIGACLRNFSVNPGNVDIDNETARISNRAISILPDCPFSGGEIKTISVKDTGFKSYYFYAPAYVEARVRLFNKTGQGAACWLWGVGTPEDPGGPGPWNEIDLFELNGVNRNIFTGTYHWSNGGVHVSQNHSVYLTDSLGLYDLTAEWTIFGLEWNTDVIRWYVNNTLVKELDLHRIPPYCIDASTYAPPVAPFSLRMGTSYNSVGNQSQQANPADFPQSMIVDYVRVYQKAGTPKTPVLIHDHLCQFCSDTTLVPATGKPVGTRYYPGYQYQWNATVFEMIPQPDAMPRPPERYLLRIREQAIPGAEYPVALTSVDPWGVTENDTVQIFIHSGIPPVPTDTFTPERKDTSCYYSLVTPVPDHTSGSEYSLDQGINWLPGDLEYIDQITYCRFGRFKPDTVIQLQFRNINACGASIPQVSVITIPPPEPGCKWPTGTDGQISLDDQPSIVILPNPATRYITVKRSGTDLLVPDGILEITDITGKTLLRYILQGTQSRCDISRLAPGMYLLRMINQDGTVIQKRFIRN